MQYEHTAAASLLRTEHCWYFGVWDAVHAPAHSLKDEWVTQTARGVAPARSQLAACLRPGAVLTLGVRARQLSVHSSCSTERDLCRGAAKAGTR